MILAIDAGVATILAAIITAAASILAVIIAKYRRAERSIASPRSKDTVPTSPEKPTISPIKREPRPTEPQPQGLLTADKRVGYDDDADYRFSLEEGDRIVGTVQSDGPVNIYLFDSRNHSRWTSEDDDFTYLDGDENILRYDFDTIIDQSGNWYLSIETVEEEDVLVKIRLKRIPVS